MHHHIIVTVSIAYDEEVIQGGMALYFKHMSKGQKVTWYDSHIQNTGNNSSSITYKVMCTNAAGHATSRVSLYIISHSVGGTFGGLDAHILASMLRGFLKYTVKVPTGTPVEKLSLIGCGTARGDAGTDYISKVGLSWESGHPIKIVAWTAYVTLFDIRFLIKLFNNTPRFATIVNRYVGDCLRELAGSSSSHALQLRNNLTTNFQATTNLYKNFRAFTAEYNAIVAEKIREAANEAIYNLIGKKVNKLVSPGNYFSNPPAFLRIGAGTEDSVPRPSFGDSRDQLRLLRDVNFERRVQLALILRRIFIEEICAIILDLVGDLFEWQYYPEKAKVSLIRHAGYEQ